eukprot:1157887-Pelagomonas_calceolata.AAC.10
MGVSGVHRGFGGAAGVMSNRSTGCAARAATAAAAPAAAGPFAVAGSFQGFPVSPFRAATHARSPHAPALQHDASQGWQLKASNPTGDACAGGGCAQPAFVCVLFLEYTDFQRVFCV